MGWKKWPYWLKGALIGLIIAILGSIAILFGDNTLSIFLIPFYIFIMFMYILYELIVGFQGEFGALVPAIILSLIVYPLIGALIGFIVGKIKKK